MKKNFPITGNELNYADNANILSTTDLKGIITYVNDDFTAISGFTTDELLHKSHNIVRHPEMPPAAFEDLWATIKSGKSWMGIVKNRCKNGDHYCVSAYVTPILRDGQVVEYQSVRTKPKRELVQRAERLYAELMAGRTPLALRIPRLGIKTKVAGAVAVGVATGLAVGVIFGGVPLAGAAIVGGVTLAVGGLLGTLALSPLCQVVAHARTIANNPVRQCREQINCPDL